MIGGGIMGVAAATFLAEDGLRVTLYERSEIAAGASGRNSGAIQRPGDEQLAALQDASLRLYRELAESDTEFSLPHEPAGLLIVSAEDAPLAEVAARLSAEHPSLRPEIIRAGDAYLRASGLARDVGACRLEDAYPVAPAAATRAFARRALRAGVSFQVGREARPRLVHGAVAGVKLDSGEVSAFGRVVVAAGPWTPRLIRDWNDNPPIRSVWGVVVGVAIENPPRPVLEELGIEARGGPSDVLFSLVTASDGGGDRPPGAGGSVAGTAPTLASSVGSTFLPDMPDAGALVEPILRRAARFVPAIGRARPSGVRLCARPVSFDGRPLIGHVPDVSGLYVCAGHGPWGISTGPASARLVADIVLGTAQAPPELDPARSRDPR